jgi:hypothetical protein
MKHINPFLKGDLFTLGILLLAFISCLILESLEMFTVSAGMKEMKKSRPWPIIYSILARTCKSRKEILVCREKRN